MTTRPPRSSTSAWPTAARPRSQQQTADGNQPVNGITCLCWNYPCDGFQVLIGDQGRVAARIGYGYQEHPGEFLAMLAMSRVPPTTPSTSGRMCRR